jgi:Uncharacterized BCR, YaiI/YqxD family COG1671
MTWILDGNNVMGLLSPGARRDRQRFLEWLLARKVPLPALVVFDGPPPSGCLHKTRRGKVLVQYASPRTADHVILARARPGDLVVTADRDLALSCRDRGARVVNPAEYLELIASKRSPESEKPSPTSVDVDDWLDFFHRS